MNDVDERLTDLEIRYTHQAELVATLNDLVRAQQTTIDRLVKAVSQLQAQLAARSEEEFPHEKPPHY